MIATPVVWKNRVYVAIGQDPEHGDGVGILHCIDATKTGDVTHEGKVWSYKDIGRSISTVSITEDGLLFVAEYAGKIHCLDAETGKPYWVHDTQAHIWGSTLVADGKLYIGTEDGNFLHLQRGQRKEAAEPGRSRRAGVRDAGGGQRCSLCANADAVIRDCEGEMTRESG